MRFFPFVFVFWILSSIGFRTITNPFISSRLTSGYSFADKMIGRTHEYPFIDVSPGWNWLCLHLEGRFFICESFVTHCSIFSQLELNLGFLYKTVIAYMKKTSFHFFPLSKIHNSITAMVVNTPIWQIFTLEIFFKHQTILRTYAIFHMFLKWKINILPWIYIYAKIVWNCSNLKILSHLNSKLYVT